MAMKGTGDGERKAGGREAPGKFTSLQYCLGCFWQILTLGQIPLTTYFCMACELNIAFIGEHL